MGGLKPASLDPARGIRKVCLRISPGVGVR